ncbi:MAG: Periplasmic component of the Tol biopolymer transport system [Cyanobacteria bacterium RYN_339]|nr:Periplasmic component of the Tol biopolymer transport system [Cyanobacteria bacterium RYN_339]
MKRSSMRYLLPALLLTGCGAHLPGALQQAAGDLEAERAKHPAPAVIKLASPLRLLASADANIDAPRLAPDKSIVTFVVREEIELSPAVKKAAGLDPNDPAERMIAWFAWLSGKMPPGPVVGATFHNVVEPSFSPDGKRLIYCMQKHLPVFTRGKKLEEMRLEERTLNGGGTRVVYDGPLTLLHPMYSPNGKQIAAYARNIEGAEGLYLLDATREGATPVRITSGDDKHPVWSADGKKIFFHNQAGGDANGGGGDEHAWIGMVDLSDPNHPQRTLLDDHNAAIYHKHPSPLPGTDLVVYHASQGDENWLEVLDAKTHQHAKLDLAGTSPWGLPLSKFKHPSFGKDGKELVFVARPSKAAAATKTTKETYRVYMLPNARDIAKAFGK